jgi:hypothetical protein
LTEGSDRRNDIGLRPAKVEVTRAARGVVKDEDRLRCAALCRSLHGQNDVDQRTGQQYPAAFEGCRR